MKKSEKLIALAILASLFFVGNLWAADGATITAFNPPTGQLTRGQYATASVTIQNTGDTTRSFWVGLSFANETATGIGWPEGWYDIYPVPINNLAPGQQETVTFNFTIYKTLRYGQYYAVTSVWDSFNPATYLMENRFDSSLWHTETPAWVANPDLGMLSFSLSLLSSIPDDFAYQMNDWIKLIEQTSIDAAYENGLKPLLVMSASQTIIGTPLVGIPALDIGGALFIDLADLCEVTPEGEDGWVTVWLTSSLGVVSLGASNFSGGFGGGVIGHYFDKNQTGTADYRPETMDFFNFSCPFFSLSGVSFVRDDGVDLGHIIPGGNFDANFSIQNANADIYKFEIDRNVLIMLMSYINSKSGISYLSPQEYSDLVLETILGQADSVFRTYTIDDGDIPLLMGVWKTNLSMDVKGGYSSNANYFVIDVPENTEQLKVIAQNGTGDGSIHTRLGQRPDFLYHEGEYTYGSAIPGSITIANPPAGKYYISMPTTTSYKDMDIVATTTSLHKITASSELHGSIDPEGDVYVGEGGSITFNATPDSGYVVDRWYVDGQGVGGGISSILIQNVQADRTVLVTFKLQSDPDSETKTLVAFEHANVWSDTSYTGVNSDTMWIWWDPDGDSSPGIVSGYGLIRFNIGNIPTGSAINSVVLKMNCSRDDGGLDVRISGVGSDWSTGTINWDNKPAIGGFSVSTSSSDLGDWSWQGSSLDNVVQEWIDGNNYGLYITDSTNNGIAHFRSTLSTVSDSQKPRLVVTYTPPPPPDLIITNLYPDPSPVNDTFYVGQSVNWYVTVKNNGGGQDDSSNVGYYLGTSSTDFSNPINSDSTDALNSGESDTDNDAYLFVASDVGQRYLICKADYQDDVEESSEDNNTRVYGPFNVAENVVPELSVTPDSQTVNYSARATTFAVDNTGTGTMLWTASVTSGGDWLSITSGSSGTNSGTITAAFSANTSGSTRTGTISVTASGAGGSPKDVTVIQSGQDNEFVSGWRYTRADVTGSSYYSWGSTELTENTLQEKCSINNAYGSVLTGDVTGDGYLELIYVSGDQLKIYDGTANLLHTVALGSSSCSVSMLEDINGDSVLDIGIGTGGTSDLKTYFYDGEGNLLKTLSKSAGYDCSMRPAGLLGNGDFIISLNAGFSHSDMYRGSAVYDKDADTERWCYKVGPAFGITSIADFDGDGMLDFANEAHAVHNGCNADGYNHNGTMTTDGDIWLIVVDEQGNEIFSKMYSFPSDGNSRHYFVDLNHDGVMEIVGFEGHDPTYYHGTSEIHLFDQNGEITHTFAGSENAGWSFTITDIDGDGKDEVIASNYPGGQTLYVLDHNLAMQNSAEIAGRVQLSCDLNGDGDIEVVLLDDDGNLKVIDKNLQVLNTINVGSRGTVIAGDLDQDGIVELICMTIDHGIHVFNTRQICQLKGDINADGNVDLADAILALKVSVGISGGDVYPDKDVNGDGKIGLEEVIYILQKVSKVR